MNFDWQTATAILIVATAMIYLAWQIRGSAAGKPSGCGHCDSEESCGSQSAGRPLVSLSPPRTTERISSDSR